MTRIAMLMGLGLGLHMVENAMTLPVLLPGAKLGLANVATLLVLAEAGAPAAALFGPFRHLLGSAAAGTLLAPTFWLGFSGSLAAAAVVWLMARKQSLHTAGILSGAAFQIGQSVALVALVRSDGAWAYLPPLVALGVGAGWLTGLLAEWISVRLGLATPRTERVPWPVATGLLGLALALSVVIQLTASDSTAKTAVVSVGGEERLRLPLIRDGQHELELPDGRMVLEVKAGRIRVAFSDCDDQVCVRTGWIGSNGSRIVCAPYRTVIQGENDAGSLDGVVR